MNSPGLLTVRGLRSADEETQLSVELQRPAITPLFVRQSPENVAKLIPHLYSLCAEAQGAVARAALHAAGCELPEECNKQRLWTEFLHENLWRLLLDWPLALGLPPEKDAFVEWRAVRHGSALVEKTKLLYEQTLQPLAKQSLEKIVASDVDNSGESRIPPMRPEDWLPYWQNISTEMPFSSPPKSISEAYRSRIRAVGQAIDALTGGFEYPVAAIGVDADQQNIGVAQIRTARGILTHAARVDAGVVSAYQVWAPTDVFFKDSQALNGLLVGQSFGNLDQMRQAINQAILALDPCLPFVMEVNDA